MQDDNNSNIGGVGGAPLPQEQPPVNPLTPVDDQQAAPTEQAPIQPAQSNEASNSTLTSQLVPDVPAESPMPTPAPAPTVTPATAPVMPTNNGVPASEGNVTATPEKKKGKIWAIILSISAAVIIGIVVVVVLLMNKGGGLSMDEVEKYCKNNNLETSIEHHNENGLSADYVVCKGGEDDSFQIQYAVFDKVVADIDEFDQALTLLKAFGGSVLVDSNDYVKIYFGGYGTISYMVARGNTFVTISATNNEIVRKTLTDLGYPDDEWADDSAIMPEYDWSFDSDDDDDWTFDWDLE